MPYIRNVTSRFFGKSGVSDQYRGSLGITHLADAGLELFGERITMVVPSPDLGCAKTPTGAPIPLSTTDSSLRQTTHGTMRKR